MLLADALNNPAGTSPDLLNRRVRLDLDIEGDFSVYTLSYTGSGVDPFFFSKTLRFRLGCDDSFDCQPPAAPAAPAPELNVVIDYLSKDYSSFRQALLDFLPTRFPSWTERNEADLGMMLLELFASVADHLSDLQDRIANEAYLTTAKQRRSVAGHLALVGYALDNGASACTWLAFQVNALHSLASGDALRVANRQLNNDEPTIVFETASAATLSPDRNAIPLYNWGNVGCCLPAGALSAELNKPLPNLQIGDFLLFDDQQGARDVVRLTAFPQVVALGSPPSLITIVQWSSATPLRHDYCVAHTVVRGNLVAASHGETIANEVPRPATTGAAPATSSASPAAPSDFALQNGPLAYLDPETLATVQGTAPVPSATLPSQTPNSLSTVSVQVSGILGAWQEQPLAAGQRPGRQRVSGRA